MIDTDTRVFPIIEDLIDSYNQAEGETKKAIWRSIIATLPSGFCLGSSMTTNYQQLKTMYFQRRHHKLREWHDFCDWCETLPMFTELVIKEK